MDDRRELAHIFRQYDRFTEDMGEEVTWWELDTTTSSLDAVYDEPGNRVYKPPVRITVVQIDQDEPDEIDTHEGRHSTGSIHFGVTAQSLAEAGITFTHGHAPQHLNDIIYWDGRYFGVSDYEIRGRVRGDVVIGITAVETMLPEEFVFDTNPPAVPPYEPTVQN